MFVAVDAGAACEIALTLLERFADDPAVTPRGGFAEGRLLMRGGDYYGSAVNLASRLGELAVPMPSIGRRQLEGRGRLDGERPPSDRRENDRRADHREPARHLAERQEHPHRVRDRLEHPDE